eukprot:522579-Rhodomonas_salina.1
MKISEVVATRVTICSHTNAPYSILASASCGESSGNRLWDPACSEPRSSKDARSEPITAKQARIRYLEWLLLVGIAREMTRIASKR